MKRIYALLLAASLIFSGCSLIPKKVELFQDKVHPVPEMKASEKETLRQTAKMASLKATQTLGAALAENTSSNVIAPASDTVALTAAVSASVGPPTHPSPLTAEQLSVKLDTAMAKLNARLDDFKADNNENAGKKIEGTGWLQVPYFVWLGGFLVMAFIGFIILTIAWTALKAFALTNPPAAIGVNVAQLAARTASKGLTQLLKGGESFKEAVVAKFGQGQISDQVLHLFRSEHEKAQDEDIKAVVEHLTK